jgi:hypothetical protein
MTRFQSALAAAAAVALFASPVIAADTSTAGNKTDNTMKNDGTSSSGNMTSDGVGAPSPEAGKSTNSDGSAGKAPGADGASSGAAGDGAVGSPETNTGGSSTTPSPSK